MTAQDGVWLYGIAFADIDDDELLDVRGVAAEQVRVVRSSNLAAVVGTVNLTEFGQESLRRNMENLDWLGAVARAHDAVIGAVRRRTPIIPLRLATLYLDDDRVRRLLDARRGDFETALGEVTGRSEWGVKAYGDPTAMTQPVAAQQPGRSDTGKGKAYLLRRRAELTARQNVERAAVEHADTIHAALLRLAVDGRRKEATDPVLSGRRAWMIFNGTYLVDDALSDEFASLVKQLDADHPGVTLELTGPWPAYSFTEPRQAGT